MLLLDLALYYLASDRLQDSSACLEQHRTRFRPETEGTLAEAAPAGSRATAAFPAHAPVELAVVVPTVDQRDNVEPLLAKLAVALNGLEWEAVFVDDDSQDGTWALLQDVQRRLPHVRALRRIGRRVWPRPASRACSRVPRPTSP